MRRTVLAALGMTALLAMTALSATAQAAGNDWAEWDALLGENPQAHVLADAAGSTAERARRYARAQLESPRFYQTVLPQLFRGVAKTRGAFSPVTMVLQKGQSGARSFYYLKKPCAESELVQVNPWWDLGDPVWVCADSYRPEVLYDQRYGFYCESGAPVEGDYVCGCGRFLFNCARDQAQKRAAREAHEQQLLLTFAHVIRSRLPFSTVLTAPYSIRSSSTELVYARNRYYQTGRFQMEPPGGDEPSLRPYDPTFAAGVLGAPGYLYFDNSPRHTFYIILQDFLCSRLQSTNVVAHEMFELPNAGSGRTRDHSALAEKPGCQSCHASLENGLRAFWWLGSKQYAYHQLPERMPAGTARLYLRDQNDLRAEGPATLPWLGKALASQPEFKQCMVHKVEQLLFAGNPVPPSVHERVQKRFSVDEDLGSLFEELFVARVSGSE